MIFAAKEAVEQKAMTRGRQIGHQEGRQEGIKEGHQEGIKEGRKGERERIRKALAEQGITLTPELERILSPESDAG